MDYPGLLIDGLIARLPTSLERSEIGEPRGDVDEVGVVLCHLQRKAPTLLTSKALLQLGNSRTETSIAPQERIPPNVPGGKNEPVTSGVTDEPRTIDRAGDSGASALRGVRAERRASFFGQVAGFAFSVAVGGGALWGGLSAFNDPNSLDKWITIVLGVGFGIGFLRMA
jgi:hypothetical protein